MGLNLYRSGDCDNVLVCVGFHVEIPSLFSEQASGTLDTLINSSLHLKGFGFTDCETP